MMTTSMYLALLLPSAGMTVVFLVYLGLLCYTACHQLDDPAPVKPTAKNGLSAAELEKLPTTTGNELGFGADCAVCLDDIETEQPARVIPGCNHGFHVQCADTWLSRNPVCPVCRNKLEPEFFHPPETNPC